MPFTPVGSPLHMLVCPHGDNSLAMEALLCGGYFHSCLRDAAAQAIVGTAQAVTAAAVAAAAGGAGK